MTDDDKQSGYDRFARRLFSLIDGPVTFFRENVVVPIRGDKAPQQYYHRSFRRVPTIDDCETDDQVCIFEANEQFKRDKMIDGEIVKILRQRRLECEHFYGYTDAPRRCEKLVTDYEEAATNYFIKYGDMGAAMHAKDAYFKQKHRLIWERRHGPVGSGMKQGDA